MSDTHDPDLYPLTLWIDASTPACAAEVQALRRRDRRGRLRFLDLGDPGVALPPGLAPEALLQALHGRTAGGRLVTGLAALRPAYAAAGLGWVLAPTAWPGLRAVSGAAYRAFARHRRSLPRWVAPLLAFLLSPRRRGGATTVR